MTGRKHQNRLSFVIAAVLTTFGGGAFVRDMLLIGIVPDVLVDKTELYICITIAILLQKESLRSPTTFSIISKSSTFQTAMLIADALGCGSYLTAGINKGMLYGLPSPLCVAAGVFPAIGGGMISLIWVGVPVKKSLTKDPVYKMMVLILSSRYYQLISMGGNKDEIQVTIILATLFLCVLRALTEHIIQNADRFCKRFAPIQANMTPFFPTYLARREVTYRFEHRYAELKYKCFSNLNHTLRTPYHMLLH